MNNYSTQPIEINQFSVMFNKTKRFNKLANGSTTRYPISDDFDESSSSSEGYPEFVFQAKPLNSAQIRTDEPEW